MPKIASICNPNIIDRFPVDKPEGFEFEYIKYPCSDEELIEGCKDADILFCGPVDFIRKNVIDALPKLRLIHSLGVGFDKIDLEAAKAKGVYVCNNRAVNAFPVAEHAIGLMFSCLKQLPDADYKCKHGAFNQSFKEYQVKGHKELGGQVVGLIGMGAIGKAAAKILSAYGCKLYYNDVFKLSDEDEKALNVEFASLDDMYAKCDILSYHVPVLPETTGMINKDAISKMKQDAIVINVSRGEIVNNEDVRDALEAEKIFAGLDVIAPEPPSDDHPLLNVNEKGQARLTMTPHIAGTTDEAFIRMQSWAYENMRKVMNGERPNNIVNGL